MFYRSVPSLRRLLENDGRNDYVIGSRFIDEC